jgi:hypothetical protein
MRTQPPPASTTPASGHAPDGPATTSAGVMRAELRRRFQNALNCAITLGQVPTRGHGLGPHTFMAVAMVAQDHPDATPELIADAYDAFHREHLAALLEFLAPGAP